MHNFTAIMMFTMDDGVQLQFHLQEPDTEICANMLDALNECLQVRHTAF